MRERYFETAVGAVILVIVALCLMAVARFVRVDQYNSNSYFLTAEFNNVDGIVTGSVVKVAGITVGNVSKMELDSKRMSAILTIRINQANLELPKDTSIRIASSGLLGAKYLDVQPGSDERILQNYDKIRYTQSTINLEDIISKVVASGGNGKK